MTLYDIQGGSLGSSSSPSSLEVLYDAVLEKSLGHLLEDQVERINGS